MNEMQNAIKSQEGFDSFAGGEEITWRGMEQVFEVAL